MWKLKLGDFAYSEIQLGSICVGGGHQLVTTRWRQQWEIWNSPNLVHTFCTKPKLACMDSALCNFWSVDHGAPRSNQDGFLASLFEPSGTTSYSSNNIALTWIIVIVVDCQWSDWEPWGSCSATCGGGTKKRTRWEGIPAQNGGKDCQGSDYEEKSCHENPCSVGKFQIADICQHPNLISLGFH